MAERVRTKDVLVIDPSLQYERRLRYMEKHAGWEIFKRIFWGLYVFVVGIILLIFYRTVPGATINLESFFGWIFVIFAVFYIVFGFSTSLHLKLMRRYA